MQEKHKFYINTITFKHIIIVTKIAEKQKNISLLFVLETEQKQHQQNWVQIHYSIQNEKLTSNVYIEIDFVSRQVVFDATIKCSAVGYVQQFYRKTTGWIVGWFKMMWLHWGGIWDKQQIL